MCLLLKPTLCPDSFDDLRLMKYSTPADSFVNIKTFTRKTGDLHAAYSKKTKTF